MTSLRSLAASVGRWIDAVADAVVAAAGWFRFPRTVQIIEEDKGSFAWHVGTGNRGDPAGERFTIVDKEIAGPSADKLANLLHGSRIELTLRPDHFLFRPIELPRQAAEFLAGVVRAQIDRLTPWTAAAAAFGWSKPSAAGADRILVTVAATARAQVLPFVEALKAFAPESVSVSTRCPDDSDGVIKVLQELAHPILDVARVRRVVTAVLAITLLAAVGAATIDLTIGANLADQQDDLARKIAQRRIALRAGDASVPASAYHQLETRKHEAPSTVLVLEVLSQILPDHTYVTELRVEGDKLRLVGVTRDAPSLIRLIEQSNHFARATFFAPTTREPADPGERFHIEAQIEPFFTPRS